MILWTRLIFCLVFEFVNSCTYRKFHPFLVVVPPSLALCVRLLLALLIDMPFTLHSLIADSLVRLIGLFFDKS